MNIMILEKFTFYCTKRARIFYSLHCFINLDQLKFPAFFNEPKDCKYLQCKNAVRKSDVRSEYNEHFLDFVHVVSIFALKYIYDNVVPIARAS